MIHNLEKEMISGLIKLYNENSSGLLHDKL